MRIAYQAMVLGPIPRRPTGESSPGFAGRSISCRRICAKCCSSAVSTRSARPKQRSFCGSARKQSKRASIERGPGSGNCSREHLRAPRVEGSTARSGGISSSSGIFIEGQACRLRIALGTVSNGRKEYADGKAAGRPGGFGGGGGGGESGG